MSYHNLLTDDERRLLLEELSINASDDILLNAVEQANDMRANISKDMSEFKVRRNKRLAAQGQISTVAAAAQAETAAPIDQIVGVVVAAEQPKLGNKEPPGETAARVTTPTLEAVKRKLQGGPAAADDINRFIGGKLDNTQRVLKLLWARGVVGFDGTKFYKL
jgi:hypothetical protein